MKIYFENATKYFQMISAKNWSSGFKLFSDSLKKIQQLLENFDPKKTFTLNSYINIKYVNKILSS